MNAPTRFDEAKPASLEKPSLEQCLRFIDLSFECAKEAHRLMPTQGRRFQGDHATRNLAREALIDQLRLEAMEREGLPLSLLPDRPSAFEDMLPDMSARHPLAAEKSTWGMTHG